ncbi:TPA: ead/Ea22-like family protein [Escherichia coli]|nr:ead/Ea22-like family protein [Escherichia coli]HAL7841820.1 ead/Ea22-like family protein [Escherichia coli]
MKFSKFSELVNRILSNNHSHRRDMDVTIVVHSPGSIGSTPSVEVQSIHAGFDWDSGKVLIFPAQPLTTLTPEQITDITDSVRKGQSWHAYQEYKKHKEQLEKLSIELDAAKQRIAELEGNFTALAAENAGIKSAIPESRDIEDDNDNMDDVSLAEDFGFNHAIERMRRQIPETPTTDASLAEVRAQGVDAAIEAAKNLVAQEYEYKDFKAAQSDCCMYPGSDLVGKVEMTEWLVDFAAQLRKGGNQ